MSNKKVYLLGGVFILIIILVGGSFGIMGVLPPGEYRPNEDCTFITNAEDGASYGNSQAWITLDAGGGMIGYGYSGTTTLDCDPRYTTMISTKTIEGYDICKRNGYGYSRLHILAPGNAYQYEDDDPQASNAILECPCEPDCSNAPNVCEGQSFPSGCEGVFCYGTMCCDTTWTPPTSDYCVGVEFTQTSNCGNTRTATGTTCCPDCTCSYTTCNGDTCDDGCGGICHGSMCCDTYWEPPTSDYCIGEEFTQTSNCGNTRQAGGTTCCPNCGCAANTCEGETCGDGCGGLCAGTKVCITCTPDCTRPDDLCIEASDVPTGCNNEYCTGSWQVVRLTTADNNCDYSISRSELDTAVNWYKGDTMSRQDLAETIQNWAGG